MATKTKSRQPAMGTGRTEDRAEATSDAHRKARPCPACGGMMVRASRPDTITYKAETISIQQPGWWCQDCEEAEFDPEDQEAADRAFQGLRAKVDGILLPEQVRAIRKRLGLSQRKAGELLGGGPRAFQKYERGQVTVSKPMSNLLRLLDADPTGLADLSSERAS